MKNFLFIFLFNMHFIGIYSQNFIEFPKNICDSIAVANKYQPIADVKLLHLLNSLIEYNKNCLYKNPEYVYKTPKPVKSNHYGYKPYDSTLFDIRLRNYWEIKKPQPDTISTYNLNFLLSNIIDFHTSIYLYKQMEFDRLRDSVIYNLFIEALKYDNPIITENIIGYIIAFSKRKWIDENSNKIIQIMRNNKCVNWHDTTRLYPFLKLPQYLKDSLLKNPLTYNYFIRDEEDEEFQDWVQLARLGDIYYESKLIRKYKKLTTYIKDENYVDDEWIDALNDLAMVGSKRCIIEIIKSLDTDVNPDVYNKPSAKFYILMALYTIFDEEALFHKELAKLVYCNSYDERINYSDEYYEKVRNWALTKYNIKLKDLPRDFIIFHVGSTIQWVTPYYGN